MEVAEQPNGHWRMLSETVRTRAPIQILPTKHYGWHDIGVFDQGGGINPGFESVVRFTGHGYDGSPSDEPLPKHLHGRTVLTFKENDRPLF